MVERCNPVCWPDGYGGTDPCMQINKDGEYVSFADHEAELAALRLNTGCARGQHTTQFCAEVVTRDAIISALLEMLRPDASKQWRLDEDRSLYARACEIAGRAE